MYSSESRRKKKGGDNYDNSEWNVVGSREEERGLMRGRRYYPKKGREGGEGIFTTSGKRATTIIAAFYVQ